MRAIAIVLLILLLALAGWFFWPRQVATFSGTLRDSSNEPVAGGQVSVGGNTAVTDDAGRFEIQGRPAGDGRWVLNVQRPGFAPISKVFTQGSKDIALTAVKTTTQTFDAASSITLQDIRTTCVGSPATGPDWAANPQARFPQVFDASGNRVTGVLPAGAQTVLAFLAIEPPCSSGVQLSIPANSLVTSAGQPAQGPVDVEIATIDLYSADGMPGDYTVAGAEKNSASTYMESFGAGTITVRSGNDTLQLRPGAEAEILIPVDRGQTAAGAQAPASIPLLQYDSKSGVWQTIGSAALDPARQNYVAAVGHFSEFNADVVKTNPACVRFDASGIATGTFELVTTARTSTGGFKRVTQHVQPNSAQVNPNLHAVFNLPANDWVSLRVIKAGVPVGTWVVGTGAPWSGTGRPMYDYGACGAIFSLSDTLGTGITLPGSNRRFGPLPKHVAYLVKTTGGIEDVYPVGGTNCAPPCSYVFSIFDTGSTVVKLDNTLTTFMGVGLTADPKWDVDVRINGNGVLAAGQFPAAPFGLPGAAGGAQAHSGQLRIAARNDMTTEEEQHTDSSGNPLTGFVQVNYMLAGAPLANQVVAEIDHTAMVTKGPWSFAPNIWFTVTAPNIRFFQPDDPAIRAPALTLFLEGFGPADAANSTGSTDQRHFLQNVTFTEGSNRVFDEQTTASPKRFFYDSGTTFTVISQAMATALGAMPAAPNMTAGCSSINTTNFVQLDSIVIVGMNGMNQLAAYRINDAEVCVDVATSVISTFYPDPANPTGPVRRVDAIIGSNLFDQATILWNGPKRTLGILQ